MYIFFLHRFIKKKITKTGYPPPTPRLNVKHICKSSCVTSYSKHTPCTQNVKYQYMVQKVAVKVSQKSRWGAPSGHLYIQTPLSIKPQPRGYGVYLLKTYILSSIFFHVWCIFLLGFLSQLGKRKILTNILKKNCTRFFFSSLFSVLRKDIKWSCV